MLAESGWVFNSSVQKAEAWDLCEFKVSLTLCQKVHTALPRWLTSDPSSGDLMSAFSHCEHSLTNLHSSTQRQTDRHTHTYNQCFLAFLMLGPFNTVTHVLVVLNHRIILLLLHNCNSASYEF